MPKHKIKILVEEIEKKNYHLFIALDIKEQPARLLIDTGASKTVFDRKQVLKFVKEKKIKAYESRSVGLGTSNVETSVVKLKELQRGKLKIKSFEVAVLDLAHVNESYRQLGLPLIDGVLGSDFLKKYAAVIDYRKEELVLHLR